MAANGFNDLTDSWDEAKRYTAVGEVDALISNTSERIAFFTMTTVDLPVPGVPVRQSSPLQPYSSIPVKLPAGTRVWLGGRSASINIETL